MIGQVNMVSGMFEQSSSSASPPFPNVDIEIKTENERLAMGWDIRTCGGRTTGRNLDAR